MTLFQALIPRMDNPLVPLLRNHHTPPDLYITLRISHRPRLIYHRLNLHRPPHLLVRLILKIQ